MNEFKDIPVCKECGTSLLTRFENYPTVIDVTYKPTILYCTCPECDKYNKIELKIKFKMEVSE